MKNIEYRIFLYSIFYILFSTLLLAPATAQAAKLSVPTFISNLQSGLAGWWTFDGPNMVTNISDSSGSGNNMSWVRTTTSIAHVSGQNKGEVGTTTLSNLSFANPLTTGNTIIIIVQAFLVGSSNPTISTPTLVAGSGATLGTITLDKTYSGNSGSNRFTTSIYHAYVSNGGTATIGMSGTWTNSIGIIDEYSGMDPSSPVYGTPVATTGTSNTENPGSISTPAGGVGIMASDELSNFADFIYTQSDNNIYNLGTGSSTMTGQAEYKLTASAGSQTMTANPGANSWFWTAVGAAYQIPTAATTTVPGKIGQAVSFVSGTGAYMSLGSTISGVKTISFWAKPNSTTQSIIDLDGSKNIALASGAVATNNFSGTVYVDGAAATAFPNTNWHFVTITVSAGVDATALIMGKVAANYYGGALDDVRFYTRVLSAGEITQLHDLGAGGKMGVSLVGPSNLSSGLVGWWTLDGKNMAPNVIDSSGSGNNGNLAGATTTVPGKLGQALSFNGSTYVDMGTGMAGTFPAMTISAWVKPSSFASWRAIVQTANTGDKALYLQSNYLQFYSACNSTGTVSPSVWTHVVATVDGSDNIIYYINGSSSGGCHSASSPRVVEYLHISGINTGDSENFVGSIDDVRVYNRALSATEVAQLYTLGAGSKVAVSTAQPTGLTSGLAGWWTFDGPKMIPNVIDSSGLGNNGNLAGATTTVPGKIGQALSFNGGSDSVLLSSSISTGGTNNWSVSAWTKTTNSGVNSVLSNSSGGPVTNDLRIDTSKIAYYHYDGSWKEEFGTSNIADGRWHNLIWVNSNNQTINLYVDGNLENNGAPSATTNNGPVNQIGRNWSLSATAAIDDVRVYNRALSASEVAQLYTMGK